MAPERIGDLVADRHRLVRKYFQNHGPAENNAGKTYDLPAHARLPRSVSLTPMRDDYLQNALKVVGDPAILVNVVSRRVKQLRRGNRPLVESLEKMTAEDTALREIAEGKISFELASPEELARR